MRIFTPTPRTGLLLLILSAALFSTSSYALTCKRASDGSVEQIIPLDHQINVSTANLTAGTVLWRSQTFTSTFKCTDTNNHPQGEDAYLWWDPDIKMSAIHNSLEVGVTFLGSDINPTKIKSTDIGPGTVCQRTSTGRCKPPALPQTITASYAIYIKATGNPPPADGIIKDQSKYAVFQVDGEGGLNNHDAYALAGNEVLDQLCQSLAAPRRHTAVIRDIWMLQLQLLKRTGSHPARTMEHQKFRAAFDLLAMRAEVEGGETVELAKWWHEYQLSNQEQRRQLVQEQQKLHPAPKKKYYRRRKPKAAN